MNAELLSLARAASILGISRATASNWARDGRLPVVRHGDGGVRVPRLALEAYIRVQEREAVENIGPREQR